MLDGVKQMSKCVGAYTEDAANELTTDAEGVSLEMSDTPKVYKKAFDQFFKNSVTGCEDNTCELYDMDCNTKLLTSHHIYIDDSTDKLTVELMDASGFSETNCMMCTDTNSKVVI